MGGYVASRLGETLWLVVRAKSGPADRIVPRWRSWRRYNCSRSSSAAASFPGLAAEHNVLADHGAATRPLVRALPSVAGETWDAALLQTHLTDHFPVLALHSFPSSASTSTSDASVLSSGLAQLNKYLSRAWYRAGIPVQMHEDCTQAVYTTMLQQLGRDRFDALISDVGRSGIKDVFSREPNEGLDFFRAVDMIKKRALRERVYHSLDAVDVPASSGNSETKAWSDALRETIDHSLSPREASLINETLMGKTPAEIALHLGRRTQDRQQREDTRSSESCVKVLLAQNANSISPGPKPRAHHHVRSLRAALLWSPQSPFQGPAPHRHQEILKKLLTTTPRSPRAVRR